MQLSKRLRAVADLVPGGTVLADVGTDHAYIPIALVEEGKIPRALAMDINQGPLMRAEENIKAHGLEEKIEIRLSDGLEKMKKGEADAVLIAGMGGLLTVRILSGKREILDGATLVLQPQSDLPSVRGWLAEEGYAITAEDLVLEDGKYYPMMRAQKCGGMSEAKDRNHCLEIPGKIMEENTEEQSSGAGDTENQRKLMISRLNMKQAKRKRNRSCAMDRCFLKRSIRSWQAIWTARKRCTEMYSLHWKEKTRKAL